MAQNTVAWLLKAIAKTLAVMALGFLIAGCTIILGAVIGGAVAATGAIGALVGASIGAVVGIPLGLMGAWNAAWAIIDNKKNSNIPKFESVNFELSSKSPKYPPKSSPNNSPKKEVGPNLNKSGKPELPEPLEAEKPKKKSWW